MMSFLYNAKYDKDHQFTSAQLGTLAAATIMKWSNYETFEVAEPPKGHNLAPLVQSNTLKFWKKAVSFYMPNQLMQWSEISSTGNPTRSAALNALIKYVKKQEVCGQGAPSQAWRSIKVDEYWLKSKDNINWKYGIPALMNYQFHLILRIDDSTQARIANLKPHNQFRFILKTRLMWCVHLSTTLWLEAPLMLYLFGFTDETEIPSGGICTRTMVQKIYQGEIFFCPQFANTGPLGSHSVRNLASLYCCNKGASEDEKHLRGQWKSGARVSDIYDDLELPYPGAKVAALLCVGGPSKYHIQNDSRITTE